MSETTTMQAPTAKSSQQSRKTSLPLSWTYSIYLAILAGLPAMFLLSSILIARSASFPAEAADPFLLHPDYAFNLRHVNCEVVVYGDSTAVTGIDPTVVQSSTGLKTCNIAQSQSILEVAGPIALDTYLKNNRPPKYLLIQLAPETLSRKRGLFFWPEGLTMLLRKRPLPVALFTMIQHPVESFGFAIWAINTKLQIALHRSPDFSTTNALFESHKGLVVLPKPPETACSRNLAFWPPSPSWTSRLRQRYSVNGTRVLINVSPIPDCAANADRIAASMKGVTDNSLSVYPIHLFCDLDRHLTLEGAERSSNEIAQQILALEHQTSSSLSGN
jgi:hypothetical protein